MGVDTRARAIALLIATFVAGAIAGAAVWPRIEPRRLIRIGGEVEAERIPAPLIALGLSKDEEARLHAIAGRWRPRADSEFKEVRRHVGEMENGMFAEMLCVLPADKQDRYLKMLQDQKYDSTLIDKRFAIVRANRCGELQR